MLMMCCATAYVVDFGNLAIGIIVRCPRWLRGMNRWNPQISLMTLSVICAQALKVRFEMTLSGEGSCSKMLLSLRYASQ